MAQKAQFLFFFKLDPGILQHRAVENFHYIKEIDIVEIFQRLGGEGSRSPIFFKIVFELFGP